MNDPEEQNYSPAARRAIAKLLKSKTKKKQGSSTAYRLHLSPHEWTWTQQEQEEMAHDLLEAFDVNKQMGLALEQVATTMEVTGTAWEIACKATEKYLILRRRLSSALDTIERDLSSPT